MLKAAAAAGYLNEKDAVLESLIAIKRAVGLGRNASQNVIQRVLNHQWYPSVKSHHLIL